MVKKNYYCKEKDLVAELEKYKQTNIISEELGKMFIDIATHYIKYNFSFQKYPSDLDDFVGEAVLRMVGQVHKFDLNHPKANAFTYFTTVAHRCAIAEIKKNILRWERNRQLCVTTHQQIEHTNLFIDTDEEAEEANRFE